MDSPMCFLSKLKRPGPVSSLGEGNWVRLLCPTFSSFGGKPGAATVGVTGSDETVSASSSLSSSSVKYSISSSEFSELGTLDRTSYVRKKEGRRFSPKPFNSQVPLISKIVDETLHLNTTNGQCKLPMCARTSSCAS